MNYFSRYGVAALHLKGLLLRDIVRGLFALAAISCVVVMPLAY